MTDQSYSYQISTFKTLFNRPNKRQQSIAGHDKRHGRSQRGKNAQTALPRGQQSYDSSPGGSARGGRQNQHEINQRAGYRRGRHGLDGQGYSQQQRDHGQQTDWINGSHEIHHLNIMPMAQFQCCMLKIVDCSKKFLVLYSFLFKIDPGIFAKYCSALRVTV